MKKFIAVYGGKFYEEFHETFRYLAVDQIVNIVVSTHSGPTTIHFVDTNDQCYELVSHFDETDKAYECLQTFIGFLDEQQ